MKQRQRAEIVPGDLSLVQNINIEEHSFVGNRSQEQYVLLTDYDARTAYSEAYHTLFANIRLNWDSDATRQHTLLVTTPAAYVEQAAAVANVAIAAAQSGIPTLLVDADLRTPGLQQRFG